MSHSYEDSADFRTSRMAQVVAETWQVVSQRKREVPLAGVRALAGMQRRTYDLLSALRNDGKVSLIAQIKRTSPDMPRSLDNYNPLTLAHRFESLGARALLVATNQQYYRGDVADLTHVSSAVQVPIIRQDFIFDEYQIVEARAAGADAVLLIAALLEAPKLRELISITQRNRMTAMVQVASQAEIERAVAFEPRVIAINNRDMETLAVDLDRTLHLREYIPAHMGVVSLGGLRTAEDVAYVHQARIDAIVVGQALLMAPDAAAALQELFKLTENGDVSDAR
ncbi:MAG: indole-3-glycerol phosphate synthase TrpC [Anaerolineales bacterium]